ncbi:MAG: prepilin-type N-terminal cleavage/methylation domain-containing protein [Gemmatimonadetes bacterium]|nr:prepilin-type N-terminal cleavage/methylation domain-containing protein [Gemmatimonadota bacterium]
MRRCRAGFSLLELVVSLALGGLVAAALGSLVVTEERLARVHSRRVEWAEAVRAAAAVLAAELRFADAAADLSIVASDSIRLRAFRGTAIACAGVAAGALVRYRGMRAPNAAKDSVLPVESNGPGGAAPLAGSRRVASGCRARAGEDLYTWSLGGIVLSPGTMLLLYESGSYHLSGAALRYRRGGGGRQPLTPETLDDTASSFRLLLGTPGTTPGLPAALEVRLAAAPEVAAPSGVAPPARARLRLALLNPASQAAGAGPPREGP